MKNRVPAALAAALMATTVMTPAAPVMAQRYQPMPTRGMTQAEADRYAADQKAEAAARAQAEAQAQAQAGRGGPPPAPSGGRSGPPTQSQPPARGGQTQTQPSGRGGPPQGQPAGRGGQPQQGQPSGRGGSPTQDQPPGRGGRDDGRGGPSSQGQPGRGGRDDGRGGYQGGRDDGRGGAQGGRGGRDDGRGGSGNWDGRGGPGGWDGRGNDGRGPNAQPNRGDRDRGRPRYDPRRYPQQIRARQHFQWRGPIYRTPPGFYVRLWSYGDYLPYSWYMPNYYIDNWWAYGLDYPPIGFEWVRIGRDAVLVDVWSGRIYQVVYDLFW